MIRMVIEHNFNKLPEFKDATLLNITELKRGSAAGDFTMELDWEHEDGMSYAASAIYNVFSTVLEVG